MPESPWSWVVAIVLGLVTTLGNIFISRQAGRATVQTAQPALITAQGDEITKLWKRLDERDKEIERIRGELDAEREKCDKLERRVYHLEMSEQTYKDTINALQSKLNRLGGDMKEMKENGGTHA